jgi:steroid 5-alpha reductase family enzyme
MCSLTKVKRQLVPTILVAAVILAIGVAVSVLFVVLEDWGYLSKVAEAWGRIFTLLVLIAVATEVVRRQGRRQG